MTDWFENEVIANEVRLHYYRTGRSDKPSVLIVPGVTDMGSGYARVAQALASDYDVITYDKRGHGYSEKVETGYTFEDHAADLVALITVLGIERPRVIAHSGGAAAAIIAAANYPTLMTGLILYDPCWGSGWGGWETTAVAMREWFNGVVSLSREELTTKWRKDNPTWTEDEITAQVESKVRVSPHVVQTFDQPEPRWREALPKITCPMLLLTGDKDNGLISEDDVQAMSSLWQDGSVVQIEGADHMVHYDCYEAFVASVQAFLTEI